ncbi:MAG TPA: SDR family NAD(P)-dependent oxidoreductase, partial [Rudaea sp.]|nr:SDR family NAD(P)-dependent oxidoreductase [Rudaea sp.]
MSKRVAVVSGGIGGLGTEICKYLARSGRKVIAADLGSRAERVAEFQKEVAEFDIGFESVNVGDADACTELTKSLASKHGSIDILVNAAGITRDTTLRKMTPEQWHDVLDINLTGVFNL